MKNFFIWLAKSERWAVGGGRCRSWVGFIRILFYPLTFVLSGLAIKANNTKWDKRRRKGENRVRKEGEIGRKCRGANKRNVSATSWQVRFGKTKWKWWSRKGGQMNSQNCKVPPNHPPIFLGPSPLTPPTNGHCIIYQLVPLAFPGKNSSESLSVSQVFLSLFFFVRRLARFSGSKVKRLMDLISRQSPRTGK